MKYRFLLIASLLMGISLVGCSGSGDGSQASSKEKVEIPDDIKKADLPPQAQAEMAKRMGQLPEGAAKPVIGADGKVASEPGAPAEKGK